MSRNSEWLTAAFYRHAFNRNQLYAVAVLPPVIFLFTGHVVLGLVFLLCVVGGRLSRSRPSRKPRAGTRPGARR